mgnify:CR=1 FL=1
MLIGYPAALNRVLLNLTTNALKFTAEGMVEVAAIARNSRCIEFSVRDSGPGVPDEVVDSLFQPFDPTKPSCDSRKPTLRGGSSGTGGSTFT